MAIPVFLIIVGLVIIIHEFGHFIIAKRQGVKVEEFIVGFGPKIFATRKGDTEYGLSLIPLGGYVKLAGDNVGEYKGNPNEYLFKTPGQRAKIIFFGPLLNYILGFLCFWLILLAFPKPMLTTKVGGLVEGLGAQQAGIQAGDTILAIDGRKVNFWEDIQKAIRHKKKNTRVDISILRNNQAQNLFVKIKEGTPEDIFKQKQKIKLLGITPSEEIVEVRYGLLKSFTRSIEETLNLTVMTYRAIWLMITGNVSLRESLAGPLGFLYITHKYAKQGIIAILYLLGVLSINLCIFNLLPLPVLDGGHLVLLTLEKIRGRPLSHKTERIVTNAGFTFIVLLAVIATGVDILRFIEDKTFFKWLIK